MLWHDATPTVRRGMQLRKPRRVDADVEGMRYGMYGMYGVYGRRGVDVDVDVDVDGRKSQKSTCRAV